MIEKAKGGYNLLIGPKVIPTSATDECIVDCWIHTLHITNPTAGAITVTVQDRQAVPITLVPGEILNAGDWFSMESSSGRAFPGGFSWQATAPGLHGFAMGVIR